MIWMSNAHGVRVWLDRNQLSPGMYWQDAIRAAIEDGSCFFLEGFGAGSAFVFKHEPLMNPAWGKVVMFGWFSVPH
jgi:hypothetical protein